MSTQHQNLWREMLARSFDPRQWFEGEDSPILESRTGDTIMWVYREEGGRFLVGWYSPEREWHPDTVWKSREQAAARVSYLNGNGTPQVPDSDS